MLEVPLTVFTHDLTEFVAVVVTVIAVIGLVVVLKRLFFDSSAGANTFVVGSEIFESTDEIDDDFIVILLSQPVLLRKTVDSGSGLVGLGQIVRDELRESPLLPKACPLTVVEGDETVEGVANKRELVKLVCVGELSDGGMVLIKATQTRFAESVREAPTCRAWYVNEGRA